MHRFAYLMITAFIAAGALGFAAATTSSTAYAQTCTSTGTQQILSSTCERHYVGLTCGEGGCTQYTMNMVPISISCSTDQHDVRVKVSLCGGGIIVLPSTVYVGIKLTTGALLSGYATPTGTGSTDYIIDFECITGSPTKTYVSGTGGVNIEGIVTTVACCGSECW